MGRLLSLFALAVIACFLLARTLGPVPTVVSAPAATAAPSPSSAPAVEPTARGDATAAPRRPRAPLAADVRSAPKAATIPGSIVSDGEAVRPLPPRPPRRTATLGAVVCPPRA